MVIGEVKVRKLWYRWTVLAYTYMYFMDWTISLKINKAKSGGETEGGNFTTNMVNTAYHVHNFGGHKAIKFAIFRKVPILNPMQS